MPIFAAVALLAFAGSYLGLRVFRRAAIGAGLLDVAGVLKHHQGEVPMVGGLAILAGYLLALVSDPTVLVPNSTFLLVSTLVIAVGTLDDRFGLSPVARLVVQLLVGLLAVFVAGLSVDTIGAPFFNGVIEMGWLAIPFSVLVFVGGINAWNMIDGIDGLAALFAFIGLSCMLIVSGEAAPSLQASLLALLCGISAFFLFNLPFHRLRSQKTFLGDAGSMFLGLAIVWHALSLSQGGDAVMSPVTALWFVALPVYDVLTTTLRRVLRGKSPLNGDRMHLHHLLQDLGLSVRHTLLIMSALALASGVVGLLSHFAAVADGLVFTLFTAVGAIYFFSVRYLGRLASKEGPSHGRKRTADDSEFPRGPPAVS